MKHVASRKRRQRALRGWQTRRKRQAERRIERARTAVLRLPVGTVINWMGGAARIRRRWARLEARHRHPQLRGWVMSHPPNKKNPPPPGRTVEAGDRLNSETPKSLGPCAAPQPERSPSLGLGGKGSKPEPLLASEPVHLLARINPATGQSFAACNLLLGGMDGPNEHRRTTDRGKATCPGCKAAS